MTTLRENLAEFENELSSLVSRGETGKYAVGCSGEKFKCFDTYRDALKQGYQVHGLGKFIVMLLKPKFQNSQNNSIIIA